MYGVNAILFTVFGQIIFLCDANNMLCTELYNLYRFVSNRKLFIILKKVPICENGSNVVTFKSFNKN